MRDKERRRYEGANFTTEKVVATIYVIMFVLVVGIGVHAQLGRMSHQAKAPTATTVTVR